MAALAVNFPFFYVQSPCRKLAGGPHIIDFITEAAGRWKFECGPDFGHACSILFLLSSFWCQPVCLYYPPSPPISLFTVRSTLTTCYQTKHNVYGVPGVPPTEKVIRGISCCLTEHRLIRMHNFLASYVRLLSMERGVPLNLLFWPLWIHIVLFGNPRCHRILLAWKAVYSQPPCPDCNPVELESKLVHKVPDFSCGIWRLVGRCIGLSKTRERVEMDMLIASFTTSRCRKPIEIFSKGYVVSTFTSGVLSDLFGWFKAAANLGHIMVHNLLHMRPVEMIKDLTWCPIISEVSHFLM